MNKINNRKNTMTSRFFFVTMATFLGIGFASSLSFANRSLENRNLTKSTTEASTSKTCECELDHTFNIGSKNNISDLEQALSAAMTPEFKHKYKIDDFLRGIENRAANDNPDSLHTEMLDNQCAQENDPTLFVKHCSSKHVEGSQFEARVGDGLYIGGKLNSIPSNPNSEDSAFESFLSNAQGNFLLKIEY